jgi:hypothetical protein
MSRAAVHVNKFNPTPYASPDIVRGGLNATSTTADLAKNYNKNKYKVVSLNGCMQRGKSMPLLQINCRALLRD